MKSATFILILFTGTLKCIGQSLTIDNYEFQPYFSTEFNDPNLTSTGYWALNGTAEGNVFQTSLVSSNNNSTSDPTNTSGFLRITPHYESSTHTYYSGQVTSIHSYRYGYFETRVKMPGHYGASADKLSASSSFWLFGGVGIHSNEIDVFETSVAHRIMGAVHWGFNDGNHYIYEANNGFIDNTTAGELAAGGPTLSSDLTTSFHTFGLEWLPEVINTYYDGNLYRQIPNLYVNPGAKQVDKIYGSTSTVSIMNNPENIIFWVKHSPLIGEDNQVKDAFGNIIIQNEYPNANDYLEIDYIKYFKRKPYIPSAIYSVSGTGTLVLTASTDDPSDTYTWSVATGNISITGPVTNSTATFLLPLLPTWGTASAIINVTAHGTYPYTSQATSNINIIKSSGDICSLNGLTLPTVYFAYNIFAPQTSCSSNTSVVLSGSNVTFVAQNEINLNSGFEVQLGATFTALTR
ncbi:MAG: family 16 glycosylhydrolase [Bacteroidota bacterium]